MKLLRWIRRIAIVGLAAVPLMFSGCGLLKSEETGGQIDPPQVEYDLDSEFDTGDSDRETMAEPAKEAPVTLYFKDGNGYVAPLGVRIPAVEGIASLSLSYMVDGGPLSEQLPEGFSALLPQGTEVLAMNIRDGLATVDFSEAFTDYNLQDERKILEAVTWALTGFNSINKVQIWVEGKPLTEMPKDATPLDDPLARSMGINLEMEDDIHPSLASAVTVYFQGQTNDNYSYYVPVTRLIRHMDNMTQAAMQELVDGPAEASGLHGVFSAAAEVLNVELHDDTVVVNFADGLPAQDVEATSGAMQAVILSLTEQTGLPKVQIMVGGKAGVTIGNKTEYASPVTRPAQVNQLKL